MLFVLLLSCETLLSAYHKGEITARQLDERLQALPTVFDSAVSCEYGYLNAEKRETLLARIASVRNRM